MTTTLHRRPARTDTARAKLADVDWALVASAAALVAVGLLAIFSATRGPDGHWSTAARQALFAAAGGSAGAVLALVDYRRVRDLVVLGYLGGLGLLVAVLGPLGTEVRGTRGWFQVAGFSLQPAEVVKLVLITSLAAVFTSRTSLTLAGRTVVALGAAGLITALVLAQGEVGSVLVYAAVTLGVLAVAGVPGRWLAAMVVAGLVGCGVILATGALQDYQQQRITSFLDLEADARGAAYNQRQAITAVASGGVLGQGLFAGPQTQLNFVPEKETDFIFTVVGEELGFVGGMGLLALYGVLLARVLRAAQLARDDFGALLCVGVLVMLLVQLFQNVGMAVGIMPITGIPLPLVSYGGSSMVTTMVALGLVLSVTVHRHRGSPV
jgi:rod shape determining protein RodA